MPSKRQPRAVTGVVFPTRGPRGGQRYVLRTASSEIELASSSVRDRKRWLDLPQCAGSRVRMRGHFKDGVLYDAEVAGTTIADKQIHEVTVVNDTETLHISRSRDDSVHGRGLVPSKGGGVYEHEGRLALVGVGGKLELPDNVELAMRTRVGDLQGAVADHFGDGLVEDEAAAAAGPAAQSGTPAGQWVEEVLRAARPSGIPGYFGVFPTYNPFVVEHLAKQREVVHFQEWVGADLDPTKNLTGGGDVAIGRMLYDSVVRSKLIVRPAKASYMQGIRRQSGTHVDTLIGIAGHNDEHARMRAAKLAKLQSHIKSNMGSLRDHLVKEVDIAMASDQSEYFIPGGIGAMAGVAFTLFVIHMFPPAAPLLTAEMGKAYMLLNLAGGATGFVGGVATGHELHKRAEAFEALAESMQLLKALGEEHDYLVEEIMMDYVARRIGREMLEARNAKAKTMDPNKKRAIDRSASRNVKRILEQQDRRVRRDMDMFRASATGDHRDLYRQAVMDGNNEVVVQHILRICQACNMLSAEGRAATRQRRELMLSDFVNVRSRPLDSMSDDLWL